MKDGHDIYIGPEDTLTDVRKRLEQVPTLVRSVTLIFDRQTQLRNPTDWKNLHAYARNQGKDVLIISPDAQTRAMAKAAKFRVVDSFEASSASKQRTGSSGGGHPVRRSPVGKGKALSSQQRSTLHRNGSEDLSTDLSNKQITDTSPPRPGRSSVQPPESRTSQREDATTHGTGDESTPSSFREYDSAQSQLYDFSIESDPYIRPLSPQQLEEEPDMLVEDFNLTEHIRRAAREGVEHQPGKAAEQPVEVVQAQHVPGDGEDPFAYLDEQSTPPVAEQHSSVFVDGLDTSEHPIQDIQDISEMPTDTLEANVEDQRGDMDDISDRGDVFEVDPPARSWSASFLDDDDLFEETPRVHGVRPRSSRSGYITPRPSQDNLQEVSEREETLPPLEERPTQEAPLLPSSTMGSGQPVRPPVSPAGRSANGRKTSIGPTSQAAQTPQTSPKPPTARRSPALTKPAPRQGGQRAQRKATPRSPMVPAGARSTRSRSTRMSREEIRGSAVLITIALLLLLVIGLLAFITPSARVTLTLHARDFSVPNLQLLASPGKASGQPGTVPATLLSQTFPTTGSALTGTAAATGTTPIGTAQAKGSITFTNNGTTVLTIPSGTVVQTASGIQFATIAQAVVNTSSSNVGTTVDVPIIAQQLGEAGNVPAGSITIIPASSLSMIAQASTTSVKNIKISVTNAAATSGGGAGTATVVTQADLDKEKGVLHAQLQGAVDSWVKQQAHNGDVTGTPVVTEQVVNAPAVGQAEASGTFKMGLLLTVKLLVVHSANLQQAAQTLLNESLQKSQVYQGNYMVVTDTTSPIQFSRLKTTGNGMTSLMLTFTATGKIVPKLSAQQVQSLVAGKNKQNAQEILQDIQDVQSVRIETWPPFINWLPFLAGRIQVSYAPGTPPETVPSASPSPEATATAKR
jgi:hypothetical protein